MLVLPHGVSYRVLVLPKLNALRPEMLRKIRDLVQAGATVLGEPPTQSPSMANFPKCDAEVQKFAAELWGGANPGQSGERKFGKGKIIWGKSLTEIFAATQIPADIEYRDAAADAKFLFTHRTSPDAEIYFVSNQKDRTEQVNCAFRVTGRQPELWDAVTGERRALPEWSEQSGQTIVPLTFAPKQSWFVVFRFAAQPVAKGVKNFPALKTIATIGEKWDVSFDPKWGGPEHAEFAQLTDWITRPEDGIMFYSGKATYRTTFDWPPSEIRNRKSEIFLDLGAVRDVAVVRVNGKDLGTLWTAPWRVDISAAAHVGSNSVEITVVNPWNNRLVGDAKLPVAERRTSLSMPTVTAKTPLQSAGLLGPVTVQTIVSEK